MKKLRVLMTVCILVFVLTFTFGPVIAKKPIINITYNPMPFNLPSVVERQKGYLNQAGFQVEYHTFLVGHAMSEAMVAGHLDIAPVMGGTSTIVSIAGGRDLKVIGCYSQAPAGFGLATIPNSLSLDKLKGAKIAVPIGTEAHVLLGKILGEQGLTFKDVTLVNMLVPDGMAALQGGKVDGAMVVEPVMTNLTQAGKIQVLRDGTGLISGLTLSVVPKGLVNSSRVSAFQKAHNQTIDFIENHYEEALALAVKEMNLPPSVVETVAKKYSFKSEITPEIKAELDETIEFLFQEGLIRKRISVDTLFAD